MPRGSQRGEKAADRGTAHCLQLTEHPKDRQTCGSFPCTARRSAHCGDGGREAEVTAPLELKQNRAAQSAASGWTPPRTAQEQGRGPSPIPRRRENFQSGAGGRNTRKFPALSPSCPWFQESPFPEAAPAAIYLYKAGPHLAGAARALLLHKARLCAQTETGLRGDNLYPGWKSSMGLKARGFHKGDLCWGGSSLPRTDRKVGRGTS